MKRIRRAVLLVLVIAASVGAYYYSQRPPAALVLTGIVTTNDVIVSPQISGQISQILVNEGDMVKKDQMVAVIKPDELQQESAYYAHSAEGVTSQVKESAAALRFEERQVVDQIRQAEATLASTESQESRGGSRPRECAPDRRSAAEDVEPGHRTDGSVRSGENRVRRGKGARGRR